MLIGETKAWQIRMPKSEALAGGHNPNTAEVRNRWVLRKRRRMDYEEEEEEE
jgi:hypothetical protein